MTKAAFIKVGLGLLPMDEDGREIMASLKEGKGVMVNIHSPRNIRHHRLFFALINMIVESGAWSGDREDLRENILRAAGHVRNVVQFDGTIKQTVKSISFEALSQDRFSRVFNRAIYAVSEQLLQSDDWEGLRDEIYEAVDGNMGERIKEHDERYGT